MSLDTQYVYKLYDGTEYVGVLDSSKVISPFNLREEINTGGASIDIELGVAFQDTNPQLLTDLLINEDNDFIITDVGDNIVVGSDISIDGIPALNSRVEVWEYSDYNPDGVRLFNGRVTKWKSAYQKTTTILTVVSLGVDLDNYLVQLGAGETIAQNENQDGYETLWGTWKTPKNLVNGVAQTFTLSVDTDLQNVYLQIQNVSGVTVTARMQIVEGIPTSPGAVLATVTRYIGAHDMDYIQFTLTSVLSLPAGSYFVVVYNDDFGLSNTSYFRVGYETTGTFADGTGYEYNDSSGWTSKTYDLSFRLETASVTIGNQFSSVSPSNIVESLLDSYAALGGDVTYTDSSIQTSATVVSYTFKFNTYLDAIRKCVELAPENWWWSVNPGSSVLSFKARSETPSHTFRYGEHIEDMDIEQTIEDMKNVVWFSGGDDGTGSNVLVNSSNQTSVEQYGNWLDLPSDNRVTLSSTADILAESIVNQYKDPRFRVTIFIPSNLYDLSTVQIGDIVTFANFNTLVDSLNLQVMSKDYDPDGATLILSILPPSQTKRVEDIRRNLLKQQTENNPDV